MNKLLLADYYKHCHHDLYPLDMTHGYSYLEARDGAQYPETVFVGPQYLIKKYLVGKFFNEDDIEEMFHIVNQGGLGIDPLKFNANGFRALLRRYQGSLPISIKAVPEGLRVPNGNVLLTVINTDPEFPWLFSFLETLLLNLWYPCTVATRSYNMQQMLNRAAKATGCEPTHLVDFGQRSVSCPEQASIGGFAHLLSSPATATMIALEAAREYGGIKNTHFRFRNSTEHSVMTAEGREGEFRVLDRILGQFPCGDVSVVADSYDIENFVHTIGTKYRESILRREGRFIIRPDSKRRANDHPSKQLLWILPQLEKYFGYEMNKAGFKELNPKVGVIYGDGLTEGEMMVILGHMSFAGYASSNVAFGAGGHLLQDLGRNTQNFAFKCSAIRGSSRVWIPTGKETYGKVSKKGVLKLVCEDERYITRQSHEPGTDCLREIFRNGELLIEDSFYNIKSRLWDI